MTQVDFYVLQASSLEDQLTFTCRLVEKAVRKGHRVMLTTKDADEAQKLDEVLWEFRPESFIPHARSGEPMAHRAPVLISHGDDDNSHHDLLVNLRLGVPEHFSRFQRLAEIVIQEPNILENSRRSYAYYKHRGYPVNTHKL